MNQIQITGLFSRPGTVIINFFLVVLFIILLPSNGMAQLSRGGMPLKSQARTSDIEWVNLEEVRVDELLLEDEWKALTGKKNQRIAKEIQVSIRPDQRGNWTRSPDGTLIWKLGIRGRGAKALGLVFNRYVLEEGTRIFISDPSGKNVLGAFTSSNNKSGGVLPVSYLPGDEMIIQMELPPGSPGFGELQIGSVRYAYLPVFSEKSALDAYYGSSGSCNVDINCSLGDDWKVVKNSVVRLLNIEKCTGLLINNVRQDDRAYVYTAAHCVFQNNKYQPTVFYFNFENEACDGTTEPVPNTISGARLIATGDTLENPKDGDSLDFALLELSVKPPKSYKPYYAGWNRSKSPAQNTTAIHHPSGDVKKIAVDQDAPQTSYHDIDYFPDLVLYSHWRILEWEVATTEPGSSGCPLFDQNKLMVGTLTGGQATCSFQRNDYFTKFDYAWDYYPEPSKQIKHWLDPDNTGVMTLQGREGGLNSIFPTAETGNLNVYPNPASDILYFEGWMHNGSKTEVSIFDIAGQKLMHQTIFAQDAIQMDIRDLQPGIYLFELAQGSRFESGRFIIAR